MARPHLTMILTLVFDMQTQHQGSQVGNPMPFGCVLFCLSRIKYAFVFLFFFQRATAKKYTGAFGEKHKM